MTFCSLIDLFGAGLGLIAGSFFCWGSVTITRKQANALSGACLSGNPHVAAFFRLLKIDYLTGSIFLILAFIIQAIAKFQPLSCETLHVSTCNIVVVALIVILIGLLAWTTRVCFEKRIKKELGV